MKIFIYTLFLALMALPVTYSTAQAQTAATDIQRAESYLKGLNTLKARFIQTANNGSRLTGTFYLDRPGKLRFEYDDLEDFIVADGIFIYFYDGEMQEQTNAPIGQTLADFLLRENLSLHGDITVQRITRENGYVIITMAEASDPAAGNVRMFFTEEPYALQKWQVTDAAGYITEIALQNVQKGLDLPASLFAYFAPKTDKNNFNE